MIGVDDSSEDQKIQIPEYSNRIGTRLVETGDYFRVRPLRSYDRSGFR